MIYYTADPHFGYEAILAQAGRPFASVAEMDEALVRNWNDAVTAEDTVYLIGDVGSHCTPFPAAQLARLRGHKHLIRGNHDACLPEQQRLLDYFESVTDLLELDDGAFHITLCHYPIVYIQGGYMLHGHIHNTKKEIHELLTRLPRVMNAGVDVNDFRPVTLEQLIENNRRYYGDPDRGAPPPHREGKKGRKWKAEFYPLPTPGQHREESFHAHPME